MSLFDYRLLIVRPTRDSTLLN